MHGKFHNRNYTPYHYGTIGAAEDTYRMFRLNRGDGDMHFYYVDMGYEHRWTDTHKLTANVEYNRWMSDNDNIYRTLYGLWVRPISRPPIPTSSVPCMSVTAHGR